MTLKEKLARKKTPEYICDVPLGDLSGLQVVDLETYFTKKAAAVYSDLWFQSNFYDRSLELWGLRDLSEAEIVELEKQAAKNEERRARRKEAATKSAEARKLNQEKEERALLKKLKQKYEQRD